MKWSAAKSSSPTVAEWHWWPPCPICRPPESSSDCERRRCLPTNQFEICDSLMPGRRLIFRTFQSPGDVLMLTAAVRDLHMAAPGSFQTDIRTSADALWENNPLITRLNEHEAGVETIECHYPLVHQANARPYHFIHGYAQFLEQRLGVPIPLTRFSGDVYLSAEEKQRPLPFAELGLKEGFWIVIAGGKYDFTAKWWDPAGYQAVVDHFQARIQFAQCGESGHWHPRLKNAVDLVGRTSLRDFVVLMHHAAGVLCPVTFAMHLAATVETRPGRPRRPCVVVGGARQPAHWEQYPGHQFLHTVGSLPCCARDPCWRSRGPLVGDGDEKDRKDVCERPVQLTPELRIAQCMAMISPDDVIRAIERYVGQASVGNGLRAVPPPEAPNGRARDAEKEGPSDGAMETSVGNGLRAVPPPDNPKSKVENPKLPVLLDFRHGLGDAVQLTTVLSHLRHYHPDWQIDVAAGIGKLPGVVSGQWPAREVRRERATESVRNSHEFRYRASRNSHELRYPSTTASSSASASRSTAARTSTCSIWRGRNARPSTPTAPAPRPSIALKPCFNCGRSPSFAATY